MGNDFIYLNSIETYCEYCGFEMKHPLVAVVNMAEAKRNYPECKLNYGFYALWLKQGVACSLRYGRRKYDYQEGTVVSFAPGQVVKVEPEQGLVNSSIGLLFHPDLIHGTSLGKKIADYTFFSYDEAEALHLSEDEKKAWLEAVGCIKELLVKGGKKEICSKIERLLDMCMQFYDRQFLMREKDNSDVLAGFERQLNAYYSTGMARKIGFPTVAWLADALHYSVGYFGDLIKKETGVTAQLYIQNNIIDRSKQELLGSEQPVSEIAYKLGFDYPQHFARLFKKVTGQTPSQFRLALGGEM